MADENNTSFVDADSYQGGQGKELTFQAIVMQHFNRCVVLGSVEFRGGYWETKNNTVVYKDATHEAFSNAVVVFADLLSPYFDEEMIEAEKKFHEIDMKKARDKLTENEESSSVYRYRRAAYARKLFRELSKFLYRKGYLQMGSFEEGVE